jgi:hypothetical protein
MDLSAKLSALNSIDLDESSSIKLDLDKTNINSFDKFENIDRGLVFEEPDESSSSKSNFYDKQRQVQEQLFELRKIFSNGANAVLELQRHHDNEVDLTKEINGLKSKLEYVEDSLNREKSEYLKLKEFSQGHKFLDFP